MVDLHLIILKTAPKSFILNNSLSDSVVEVVFCPNSHVGSRANVIVSAEMASDPKNKRRLL